MLMLIYIQGGIIYIQEGFIYMKRDLQKRPAYVKKDL